MYKNVHPNSIIGYHDLDTSEMRRLVKSAYEKNPSIPLTDRQVKETLGLNDMNKARPRISELIKAGVLAEYGKTKDYLTKKTVRLVGLVQREVQLQLQLA
jgi:ABC-type lipopolysaccharide export system ATPase subunit